MSEAAQIEVTSPQAPTGEGGKLNDLAKQNWQERLILFSQVKNRVLRVNSNLNFPFNLAKGKPTQLGLFAQRVLEEPTPQTRKHKLEVLPQHGRSALLGRVVFSDNKGHIYRDIDLKGIGLLFKPDLTSSPVAIVSNPGKTHSLEEGRYGLLEKETAIYDYDKCEDFLEAGIRTVRTIAIIGLEELIVNRRRTSLADAIKRGVIDQNFHPVIQVRAYGTRARIEDLFDSDLHPFEWVGASISDIIKYSKTSDLLLEDAKKLVTIELGKETITDDEYLKWFAETLGRNVGLIHKNGWLHGYLISHNITLDCRIADFDSVTDLNKTTQEKYKEELHSVQLALMRLVGNVKGRNIENIEDRNDPLFESLWKRFRKSYDAVFPLKTRKYKFLNTA